MQALAQGESRHRSDTAAGGRIPCARDGATLTPTCTIGRTQGEDGTILILRHPDGAFRRLLVTRDGRGVIAADGAEVATVTVAGADGIEVTLGGDRYRLPVSVQRTAKRS